MRSYRLKYLLQLFQGCRRCVFRSIYLDLLLLFFSCSIETLPFGFSSLVVSIEIGITRCSSSNFDFGSDKRRWVLQNVYTVVAMIERDLFEFL